MRQTATFLVLSRAGRLSPAPKWRTTRFTSPLGGRMSLTGVETGRKRYDQRHGPTEAERTRKSDIRQNDKIVPDLSAARHQVEHRATEKIGIRLTERVVERVSEKAAASRPVIALAERTGVSRLLRRGVWPVRKSVLRLGRGGLIALPLLGAGFGAWLARADYRRVCEEAELARKRFAKAKADYDRAVAAGTARGEQPTLGLSTMRWFAAALLADCVDVTAHLISAYGLYQGWMPDTIVNAEMTSLASAILSTGAAVRGECLTARLQAEEASKRFGDGSEASSGQEGSDGRHNDVETRVGK